MQDTSVMFGCDLQILHRSSGLWPGRELESCTGTGVGIEASDGVCYLGR